MCISLRGSKAAFKYDRVLNRRVKLIEVFS